MGTHAHHPSGKKPLLLWSCSYSHWHLTVISKAADDHPVIRTRIVIHTVLIKSEHAGQNRVAFTTARLINLEEAIPVTLPTYQTSKTVLAQRAAMTRKGEEIQHLNPRCYRLQAIAHRRRTHQTYLSGSTSISKPQAIAF